MTRRSDRCGLESGDSIQRKRSITLRDASWNRCRSAARPLRCSDSDILSRLFQGRVPEWAEALTPQEFRAFIEEVRAYFAKEQRSPKIDPSAGYVREGGIDYGLVNLAQGCRAHPRQDWP